MKRLTISKLMDEYQDNEVFPQEGSAADVEAVKNRVLAGAKTPAKQRGRIPTRKKVLLAGALAAIMVVLVGAGYPYIQHRLISGELFFQQTADSRITGHVHYGPPIIEMEEGRLFFNQGEDQRVDITDLISEETPYLYDGSDPDDGKTYYIIAGGTPEHYGYLEWITVPNPFDYDGDPQPAKTLDENGRRMTTSYAFTSVSYESGERHCAGIGGNVYTVQMEGDMYRPWLLAGLTQLGIPFEDAPETLEN